MKCVLFQYVETNNSGTFSFATDTMRSVPCSYDIASGDSGARTTISLLGVSPMKRALPVYGKDLSGKQYWRSLGELDRSPAFGESLARAKPSIVVITLGSNDGLWDWNLKTKENLDIAYGVYAFHVESPDAGQIVADVQGAGLQTVFSLVVGAGTDLRVPVGNGGFGIRLQVADHMAASPMKVRVVGGRFGQPTDLGFGAIHNLRLTAGAVIDFDLGRVKRVALHRD